MILGVVSDTHNRVSNVEKIIDIFNSNNVDKVIHTGDITQARTLSRFSRLNCPLLGVFGNNDLKEEGLKEVCKENGFTFQPPPFITKIENKKIAIFHEPEGIEDLIRKESDLFLVLHGHTHRYRNEKVDGVRIFNPGESAGILKGRNSVGIVRTEEMTIKRIFF